MKMKPFKQLRNKKNNFVLNKKINGITIAVEKDKNKFAAIVDGDKLDTYNTQREAEQAATQFVKQFKGTK